MDKSISQFTQDAQRVQLTQAEKARTREFLVAYMESNPVVLDVKKSFSFASIFRLAKPVPMALVLVMFVSVGTSFAAESSLPGDALYPIKVQVNENVRSFVAFSEESKAEWDSRVAVRRLQEVEKIVQLKRSDTAQIAQVEVRLAVVSDRLQQRLARLEESNKTEFAASISAQYESSMRVHSAVLQELSKKEKPNIQEKLARVTQKLDRNTELAMEVRERSERRIATFIKEPFQPIKNAATIEIQSPEVEDTNVSIKSEVELSDVNTDIVVEKKLENEPVEVLNQKLPPQILRIEKPIVEKQAVPVFNNEQKKEHVKKAEEVIKKTDSVLQELRQSIANNKEKLDENGRENTKVKLEQIESLRKKAKEEFKNGNFEKSIQLELDARRGAKLLFGGIRESVKFNIQLVVPDKVFQKVDPVTVIEKPIEVIEEKPIGKTQEEVKIVPVIIKDPLVPVIKKEEVPVQPIKVEPILVPVVQPIKPVIIPEKIIEVPPTIIKEEVLLPALNKEVVPPPVEPIKPLPEIKIEEKPILDLKLEPAPIKSDRSFFFQTPSKF